MTHNILPLLRNCCFWAAHLLNKALLNNPSFVIALIGDPALFNSVSDLRSLLKLLRSSIRVASF